MVPILAVLLPRQGLPEDLAMHVAVATALAVVALTGLSSTRAHHQRGGVRWDLLRAYAPGLACGAVGGALIADGLSGSTLRLIVGGGALAIALHLFLGAQPTALNRLPPPRWAELFTAGGLVGLASALIGIGGGSLTVPYLSLRGVDMRQAVGTSAAGGVPIAWAGAVAYVLSGLDVPNLPAGQLGYVNLYGFAGLAVASVLTAPLGARLAHRLPAAQLRRAFAVLLAGIGISMLVS